MARQTTDTRLDVLTEHTYRLTADIDALETVIQQYRDQVRSWQREHHDLDNDTPSSTRTPPPRTLRRAPATQPAGARASRPGALHKNR